MHLHFYRYFCLSVCLSVSFLLLELSSRVCHMKNLFWKTVKADDHALVDEQTTRAAQRRGMGEGPRPDQEAWQPSRLPKYSLSSLIFSTPVVWFFFFL